MQRYGLDTPEAVRVSYQVAGIGTRFLAALIDILIICSVLALAGIGALILGQTGDTGSTIAVIVYATLVFVILWGYFVLYETLWNGQTPGKRAMSIRVLRTSGYPITLPQAVIRNLIRVVEFNGIGLITMFISSDSRRLGDFAAGTIVVKEAQPVSLAQLRVSRQSSPGSEVSVGLGTQDPDELQWNLTGLLSADISLSEAFLRRAPSLEAPVRQRIGDEIATRVAGRIGAREPLDPVKFLDRVLYLREKVESSNQTGK